MNFRNWACLTPVACRSLMCSLRPRARLVNSQRNNNKVTFTTTRCAAVQSKTASKVYYDFLFTFCVLFTPTNELIITH